MSVLKFFLSEMFLIYYLFCTSSSPVPIHVGTFISCCVCHVLPGCHMGCWGTFVAYEEENRFSMKIRSSYCPAHIFLLRLASLYFVNCVKELFLFLFLMSNFYFSNPSWFSCQYILKYVYISYTELMTKDVSSLVQLMGNKPRHQHYI